MSTPPSCWCAPDDHFGLLLHPLLPHGHGDAHVVTDVADLEAGGLDLGTAPSVDEAPGLSAATSNAGPHDAIAGLLLPLVLAAALLDAARRISLTDLQPEQRALAPPIPPPRVIPAVA